MPELSLKECEGCNHREGNIEKKRKKRKPYIQRQYNTPLTECESNSGRGWDWKQAGDRLLLLLILIE